MDERDNAENEGQRAPTEAVENNQAPVPAPSMGSPASLPEVAILPTVAAPSIAVDRRPKPEAVPSPEPVAAKPAARTSPAGRPAGDAPTIHPTLFPRAPASVTAGPKPLARPAASQPRMGGAPAREERPRSTKFSLVAACVAIAAALGGVAGATGAVSFLNQAGEPDSTTAAEIAAVKNIVGQLAVDVGVMKANQEQAGGLVRAQLDPILERLSRIEKLDSDPSAKINKVLESVQRLERRAGNAAGPEVTGAATPPAQTAEAKRPIVEGWVLRRVYDGVALIQSRRGAIEIEAGERLPGLGRIEEIKRQDGRWVVVTSRGLIVPAR